MLRTTYPIAQTGLPAIFCFVKVAATAISYDSIAAAKTCEQRRKHTAKKLENLWYTRYQKVGSSFESMSLVSLDKDNDGPLWCKLCLLCLASSPMSDSSSSFLIREAGVFETYTDMTWHGMTWALPPTVPISLLLSKQQPAGTRMYNSTTAGQKLS